MIQPDSHDAWLSEYVLPNYGRYDVWPVRGAGSEVWDRDGKRYLDFAGGVAVCPLGHCHPAVVEAITHQAKTLIHVSNWYCIDKQAELARVLVKDVVEIPGKCFFSNSGAEANEGIIKLARRYGVTRPKSDGTPRYEIITFTGSFHGRTFGAMTATAQEKIHGGFGPLVPGFVYVPFNDVTALREAVNENTVAILLEPIQGESGVNPATPEFLRAADELCKSRDMLLLLDEVQCGFGRAGEMCGWKAIIPGNEILPDAISWAKAIGSGYPLGAFWVRDVEIPGSQSPNPTRLCDLLGPGTHGTTYGGSPLACAVGLATLNTLFKEDLCANSREMGTWIAAQAAEWKSPFIRKIRQFGLFIGFELDVEKLSQNEKLKASGKPASIFLARKLLDAGLMTVPAGPGVVRWLSPLNINQTEASEALGIMKAVLTALE
jgi:acetylornithine/succinyldiaminopimelate/putrescine aminotransferase